MNELLLVLGLLGYMAGFMFTLVVVVASGAVNPSSWHFGWGKKIDGCIVWLGIIFWPLSWLYVIAHDVVCWAIKRIGAR